MHNDQVDFGTVQLKEIHLSALDEMGDDGLRPRMEKFKNSQNDRGTVCYYSISNYYHAGAHRHFELLHKARPARCCPVFEGT